MIAVDTNILVAAHRRDHPWHASARDLVRDLAEGTPAWCVPWPCVHEFLAVVTHPRIFDPPTTLDAALGQVELWLASPSVATAVESDGYLPHLARLMRRGQAVGPRVHDARVAALCLTHGVTELLTADRDFSRFPDLHTRNPLVG